MKTNILNIASIAALALSGCGSPAGVAESFHDGAQGSSKSEAASQSATASTLRVLDRKQASYLTTSLRASNGTRFIEGRATLNIQPKDGGSHIALDVTGVREDGQPWRGSFVIAEAQLLGRDADLGRAPESLPHAGHSIRGLLLGERATTAQLALAREALPGMRPVLRGHVLFADGASAAFRSEYDVHCMVAPGTLGHADIEQAHDSHGRILTDDPEFQSDFCSRFAALR